MSETTGYAAYAAGAALEDFTFERREVGPEDVAMDILFCGICHSDLHLVNNDWKMSQYPIVPGHEVIGRVTAVGDNVKGFTIGEMVGVGCMVDSCRHCQSCKADEEQYCEAGNTLTYNSPDKHLGGMTYGGYSKHMVVDQDFVLHVSEKLDPAGAAPLLCAGITTYSPLKRANIGKDSQVGVIGLGGLGHMGVKIAHAMGASVTVFTTSPEKADEAKRLGASDVVLSTDLKAMQAAANRFDFILNTVSADLDINLYLNCLKHDGQLTQVGLPNDPMPIGMLPVVFKRISIAGSLIGGIKETQEVLDFCAEHDITADIELIKPSEINQAFKRLIAGDVKYRFVIDMS